MAIAEALVGLGAAVQGITDFFGAIGGDGGDDRAKQDAIVAQAAATGGGWQYLQQQMASGFYADRTIDDWGARPRSSESRDFFRTIAAQLGAIDAGYRQRGDAGAAQALAAMETAAAQFDRIYGTRLADTVRAQDPKAFARELVQVNFGSSSAAPAITPPAIMPPPPATTPTTSTTPTTPTVQPPADYYQPPATQTGGPMIITVPPTTSATDAGGGIGSSALLIAGAVLVLVLLLFALRR